MYKASFSVLPSGWSVGELVAGDDVSVVAFFRHYNGADASTGSSVPGHGVGEGPLDEGAGFGLANVGSEFGVHESGNVGRAAAGRHKGHFGQEARNGNAVHLSTLDRIPTTDNGRCQQPFLVLVRETTQHVCRSLDQHRTTRLDTRQRKTEKEREKEIWRESSLCRYS